MKRLTYITLILILGLSFKGYGQDLIKLPMSADGLPIYRIDEVGIFDKRPSKRQSRKFQKEMGKFNRLRYNVLKVWPYANAAARNLNEIKAEMNSITDAKELKQFKKSKEKSLFGEYEKPIRNLTRKQGKILIKLIDRQTGNTTHSLVKNLKSPTAAFFWQAIGGLFGYNLKDEFDGEIDDRAVELICRSIEQGTNVTYYDYLAVCK